MVLLLLCCSGEVRKDSFSGSAEKEEEEEEVEQASSTPAVSSAFKIPEGQRIVVTIASKSKKGKGGEEGGEAKQKVIILKFRRTIRHVLARCLSFLHSQFMLS